MKFNSRFLRWLVAVVLVVAFVADVIIDNQATARRRDTDLKDSYRHLSTVAGLLARQIELEGYGAIPMGDQKGWESLDMFCVDSKTGRYVTPPRFEPFHSKIKESLQEGYKGAPVPCDTDQFNLLVASGQPIVGTFLDYRLLPVISAGEQIMVDGVCTCVFVEMDVAEAVISSDPDYRDEITIFLCVLVAMMLVWDHYKIQSLNKKLEVGCEKVIKKNNSLRERIAQENARKKRRDTGADTAIDMILSAQERKGGASDR